MKTRKVLAMLVAVVMVVMAFGGSVAHASSGLDWEITTERVGDELHIAFAPNQTIDMCALMAYWPEFDETVFSMDKEGKTDIICNSKLKLTVGVNGVNGEEPNVVNTTINAGEPIFTFILHIDTSAFDENATYTITVNYDEVYDEDIVYFDELMGEFEVTYTEATEPQPSEPTTHTVKFVSNGVVLSEVEVNDGETVDEPAEPTREGYTFRGWKLNGADYDFTAPVTSDLTITAAWTADEGTMNMDVDLSNISITKNVEAGDNQYDEITFEFQVEAVSAVSPIEGVAAPAISNLTVTMSGTDKKATVNFPAAVEFPAGGVYTYHITEVTPDPVPEGWTFNANNNEYYLVLEVEPNGNALVLDKVYAHSGDIEGDKTDMVFTNTYDYEPITDLTITKTVVGEGDNPVDANVKFDFEITFSESFSSIIDGKTVEFTADVPYEFQLGDGESLFIENIPAGISYTIVEKGNEYYKGSAIAYENDVKADEVGAENFGEDVRISADAVIAESGKNKVDFTNTYGIPPITGITMHGEMIAIIALALVALVGGFVLSRKLRRSED